MNLVEFLRARLAEERVNVEGWPDHHVQSVYGARADVLADLDGKDRIVGLLVDVEFTEEGRPIRLDGSYTDAWWDVVRLLAERYAEHPDYRPEWRWTP